jgi:hypothetical protein
VAGKIYRYLIAYAHKCRKTDPAQTEFILPSSELSIFLGESPADFLSQLDTLFENCFCWNLFPQAGEDSDIRYERHWFPYLDGLLYRVFNDGSYIITYSFPYSIRERILNPKYFRYFSLALIQKFTSKYALQLYNFCFSFLNPQKNSIHTSWIDEEKLRILLGCERLYTSLDNFKKFVLHPAMTQVNAVSEINLKLNQRGRGEGRRQFQFLLTRKSKALPNGLVGEIPLPLPEEPSPLPALPLADAPKTEKTEPIVSNSRPPLQSSNLPLPDGYLPHEQEAEFFSKLPLSDREKQLWLSSARLARFEGQPCLIFPTSFQMSQVMEHFSVLIQTTARELSLFPLPFRALSNPSPEEASPGAPNAAE